MGLLDFDDEEIMRKSGIRRAPRRSVDTHTEEENFLALQNHGLTINSEDFSDSPFADRRPLDAEKA